MKYLIFYLFILISSQPAWWTNRVKTGNLISSNVEPAAYLMTSVGNGYAAYVIGTNSIYIGGVFNGPAFAVSNPSHRASIPNFQNIVLNGSRLVYAGLDIQNGTYTREYSFKSNANTTATQTFYAHQTIRNLLVQEITVDNSASNKSFTLTLHLNSTLSTPDFKIQNTTTHSSSFQTYVATILTPELPNGFMTSVAIATSGVPSQTIVPANTVKTFYFITSLYTNIESSDYVDLCSQMYVKGVGSQEDLLDIHKDSWAQVWDSGIEIGGNLPLAQIVNTSLYYILSSVRADWPFGLSPGSLSSNGYHGHGFWDTETWMYPNLIVLQPEIAKGAILQYRVNNMKEAHLKALTYRLVYPNVTGLMYPWESAFTGAEACPLDAPTGVLEEHITADISLAFRQYFYATGDVEWLSQTGYQTVKGIAEFWASRVVANPNGTFSINTIIPPDEYAVGVDDSVYTNVVVSMALKWAIEAASIVGDTSAPVEEWQNIADNMVVLFDEELQWHPEYDGYSGETIKQADVVLLGYPLMYNMSQQVRTNDLIYYQSKTTSKGPAMTYSMHTVGWLELGDLVNAQKEWAKAYANAQKPFLVWTETPTGGTTNFITGAGGFLQGVINGFGGLRIHPNYLTFYPQLPYGVTSLKIRSLNYYSSTFDIAWNSTLISVNMVSNNGQFSFTLFSDGVFDNVSLTTSPINLPIGSKFQINAINN
ncbi:hypothetical protein DICPUDRAFT_97948 [Dictyostelium purpureum]|uniref:Protein-glucosylgalactosylhydroxylysine glucosidase n=1 Tax=Dictyostelium purpureum TaxID=5786 RepID=F0ZLA6_DICPU|nr:uncharacterized protein DICPUDRAFT_97948 [Dictyostelium purpureum]EGC35268.1 hypothetical protein DICPUDRAFT_97948 [Dictyostelium purpureum]|eukprot:XP_003288194.1 hypothetical protein DICPUDRAFT_97948 [Dictyostelium purpureum]